MFRGIGVSGTLPLPKKLAMAQRKHPLFYYSFTTVSCFHQGTVKEVGKATEGP